jgi:DNA polymerase III delta prime subunit
MLLGHTKILSDLQGLLTKGNLGQSYLFFGPSMTGKRTAALAFAKFLEKGVLEAPAEREVLQDAKVIDLAFMKALEGKAKESIGIEAAREVKNFLWQRPAASPRRTLIIDDAEALTTEAQNALLKITEEPPASSLLIFISSDPDSILPTILSRVQKIYFGAAAEVEIVTWLSADHEVPKIKAAEAAKRSLGKPGLAWRLLFDENLKERLALAEKYLKTAPAVRRDFIKELIEPDDFSLRQFLAAVILELAWQPGRARVAPLWHKTLGLYDSVSSFALNPRLQLENLLMNT